MTRSVHTVDQENVSATLTVAVPAARLFAVLWTTPWSEVGTPCQRHLLALPIGASQSRQGLRLRVSAHRYAMREAVHLLRPADRDRDPAGPIPCLGIVGHIDDCETAEVLLSLDKRPVGE